MNKSISRKTDLVDSLERDLADCISNIAAVLSVFPDERDWDALEHEIVRSAKFRRRLAGAIREALGALDAFEATGVSETAQIRKVRRSVKSSRASLRLWGKIEPILRPQTKPPKTALVPDDTFVPLIEMSVFQHISQLFFASMHRVANPTSHSQTDEAEELGCYRDIPLQMGKFSHLIGAAHRLCLGMGKEKPLRFLDVGSGGGSKLLAASTCFEVCHGLEYDKNSVANGKAFLDLLPLANCDLIHGDALEFEGYGDYDVIYFFRPLMAKDAMLRMEARILEQAKPGTVLLAVDADLGGLLTEDVQALDVQQFGESIYVTGKTPTEAEVIGERAEFVGTTVIGYGRKALVNPRYWTPLIEVSARNGYHV